MRGEEREEGRGERYLSTHFSLNNEEDRIVTIGVGNAG